MRKIIYSALTQDPVFAGLCPRTYESGAVPDAPEKPFAVLTWQESPGARGVLGSSNLSLNVYDERGDYGVIDKALRAARNALGLVLDVTDEEGSRVTCVEDVGGSPDLYDPDYSANLRFNDFRVLGRGR